MPTIGRIVHYTTGRGGVCNAAIVTFVNLDGTINMAVFGYAGDTFPKRSLPEVDPTYPEGAPDAEGWHWPER